MSVTNIAIIHLGFGYFETGNDNLDLVKSQASEGG